MKSHRRRRLAAVICLALGTGAKMPGPFAAGANRLSVRPQVGCADPALSVLRPPAAPSQAPPESVYDPRRGFDPEVRLGVGHLQAPDDPADDWVDRIQLPLFSSPGAGLSHWINGGWLVPAGGDPVPLGRAGLVEVGYEVPSFVVLEDRPNGWLRLQYGPGRDATAWTHACLFEQLSRRLVFERWDARLTSDEVSPLYFRQGGPHVLRADPDEASTRLQQLPASAADYALYPLEIRGDWMRVELRRPSDYCTDPAVPVAKTVGWVRWRDATYGPTVWYHTRGC